MSNKNEENVINILESHKVYKKKMDDDKWLYFGELSEDNKPMNIGLFFSRTGDSSGSFMMMENVTGFLKGSGMCIFSSSRRSIHSVGYCLNGWQLGPQLMVDKYKDLCCCVLNDKGEKNGFAIDVKPKKYEIYQCYGDGSQNYRCIAWEKGTLYFYDSRRIKKNKYMKIFDSHEDCTFLHGELVIEDFIEEKAIMPSRVIKRNAKSFTVSGGVQTYKYGNRIKSDYDDYFKELRYDESFPSGYGIKYYDDAYFFGNFNSDGKREKVGCLRKNNNAFMGNFSGDALCGPVLTIEDGITRLCTYDNGKKNGTYFEYHEDCLFIKSKVKDREGTIGYKIYLDSFDVEEIDLTSNTVLRSASFPFKEDDEESLEQEQEKYKEFDILKSLGLEYHDYEELQSFNYVVENNQIKILSLKEPTNYLNIPKCANILASRAFGDESLCGEITTVNIREGVVEIGEDCFCGCKKLYKISMGKNVREIKKGAFKGAGFERVDFSLETKIIGAEAFAECEHLYKAYGIANDCKIDPTSFPDWCQIVTQKDIDDNVKNALKAFNPFYRVLDFITGIFKKKRKKKKLTPGEEKKIKVNVKEEKKKKNSKVKEKTVKKEIKKRYSSSFSEKIQDVLRILALPFTYVIKGIGWLFSCIGGFFAKVFKGVGGFLASMEITKERVLMALPFILLLGYTIFAYIYGIDRLEALDASKLLYDGYDFELSNSASTWLEDTDHNFFTALTLGLIQIIFIVLGFVVDIVLTILIFVLGFILMILAGIFKFIVMELLPLAIMIIYLIMLKMSSKSNKGFVGGCMLL